MNSILGSPHTRSSSRSSDETKVKGSGQFEMKRSSTIDKTNYTCRSSSTATAFNRQMHLVVKFKYKKNACMQGDKIYHIKNNINSCYITNRRIGLTTYGFTVRAWPEYMVLNV